VNTEDILAVTTTPRERRRRGFGTVVWLVSLVVAAVLIGSVAAAFINLTDDVDDLTAQAAAESLEADARAVDIETLRQQLQSFGVEPAVDGPHTDRGERGDDGRDGRDGTDGTDGTDGRTGEPGPPGPAGADGVNGSNGANGLDGLNGLDGVPGPQGPPGQSVMGPQGPAGPAGEDGTSPSSFVFVAAGVTYTCTDPEGDGVYECTQEAA
jgi:hypothetical protein